MVVVMVAEKRWEIELLCYKNQIRKERFLWESVVTVRARPRNAAGKIFSPLYPTQKSSRKTGGLFMQIEALPFEHCCVW